MKKELKTLLFILAMLAFVGCFVMFVYEMVTSRQVDETVKDEQLVITRAFVVESKVQRAITQEYKTTLTGKIKNQTNAKIDNIMVTVSVKSGYLNIRSEFKFEDVSIEAGEEFVVDEVYLDTSHNFEKVLSVEAKIGEGDSFELKAFREYLNIGAVTYIYLAGIVVSLFLVIFIGVINNNDSKVKANEELSQTQDIEAENLKKDVKVLKLKLEKERIQMEIDKLKGEDYSVCTCCGQINDYTAKVCKYCGGKVKKNKQ